MTTRSTLLVALLLAWGAGCEAHTTETPREQAPPPAVRRTTETPPVDDGASWTNVLARVKLIGASATNGFRVLMTAGSGTEFARESVDLARILDAAIAAPHERVTGRSDSLFFAAPIQVGPRLVEETLAEDPTLVVAVDFLFWYGYGANDRVGMRITDEAARLDLLEEGLAQLGRFDVPVVVGDFADMSPAVGLMLSPAQMPRRETLAALNDRLHEWADARDHVIVLPLAQLVDEMRADREFRVGAWSWPAGSATRLLQRDELHPTADGLAAIAHLVADTLVRHGGGVSPSDFVSDPDRVLAIVSEDMLEQRRSP